MNTLEGKEAIFNGGLFRVLSLISGIKPGENQLVYLEPVTDEKLGHRICCVEELSFL